MTTLAIVALEQSKDVEENPTKGARIRVHRQHSRTVEQIQQRAAAARKLTFRGIF